MNGMDGHTMKARYPAYDGDGNTPETFLPEVVRLFTETAEFHGMTFNAEEIEIETIRAATPFGITLDHDKAFVYTAEATHTD